MAAPSDTRWSDIVDGNTSGRRGRLGIYIGQTTNNTQSTVNVQVWFWTIYSCTDGSNSFYYDVGTNVTAATTKIGSKTINHTVASGGSWQTANQTKLCDYTYTYDLAASAKTYRVYAKFLDVDMLPSGLYFNTSYTIPKLASYAVSYNANGGSGAPAAQTKWYGNTLTLSSTKPTRTGYSFRGWALSKADADAGTWYYQPGGTCGKNENLTLYAVWEPNTFTISYNANGGSGAPANQTKTYGVTLRLSTTIPSRTNYNFLGWATSASATTATYTAGSNYTANAGATLYAVWELAYIKPRIEGLSISRCDRESVLSDTGTYASVEFTWKCDRTVTAAKIEFDSDTDSVDTISENLSGLVGKKSGYVSISPLGSGQLSTESTYTVRLTITDEVGYTTLISTLAGSKFAIDFKAGGKGAAFGKPAELDDVLDIAFETRLLGGLRYPVLEPETDLNNERTPGFYTGANVSDYAYVNCPCNAGTFTLIVESGGEQGQVRQTYMSCSKYKPQKFVRFYYQSTWSLWMSASSEEVVLFEDENGTDGTITFTYWNGTEWSPISAAHFRYLEIYFTDNMGRGCGYTKIWNPDGKVVHLQLQEPGATMYYRQTAYTISATSMGPDVTTAGYVRISSGGVSATVGANYIKIVRVVGLA